MSEVLFYILISKILKKFTDLEAEILDSLNKYCVNIVNDAVKIIAYTISLVPNHDIANIKI